jgi:hypothetical protein
LGRQKTAGHNGISIYLMCYAQGCKFCSKNDYFLIYMTCRMVKSLFINVICC